MYFIVKSLVLELVFQWNICYSNSMFLFQNVSRWKYRTPFPFISGEQNIIVILFAKHQIIPKCYPPHKNILDFDGVYAYTVNLPLLSSPLSPFINHFNSTVRGVEFPRKTIQLSFKWSLMWCCWKSKSTKSFCIGIYFKEADLLSFNEGGSIIKKTILRFYRWTTWYRTQKIRTSKIYWQTINAFLWAVCYFLIVK